MDAILAQFSAALEKKQPDPPVQPPLHIDRDITVTHEELLFVSAYVADQSMSAAGALRIARGISASEFKALLPGERATFYRDAQAMLNSAGVKKVRGKIDRLKELMRLAAWNRLRELAFANGKLVSDSVRLQAINSILDRTEGRPVQRHAVKDVTAPDTITRERQESIAKIPVLPP